MVETRGGVIVQDLVSRRNVVGLAWSVPVLMLAVATPAAAASLDSGDQPASVARNAVTLSASPVIVSAPSTMPRSFTQTGSLSQLAGAVPARVRVSATFSGTGATLVVIPAYATITNNQFQFAVGFTQTSSAYTFSISVVPENDPSVEFVPGGNTVVISVPALIGSIPPPVVPPSGGTFTPPPTFGPPTSSPSPTSPGVDCQVRRVIPGVKANPNDQKIFCN